MLYANRISTKVDNAALDKIMDHLKWIDSKKMSAYYVKEGKIQSCMDEEFEGIDNDVIDGASEVINADYEEMAALYHNSVVEVR